jgi:hypothetical protein
MPALSKVAASWTNRERPVEQRLAAAPCPTMSGGSISVGPLEKVDFDLRQLLKDEAVS